MQKLIYTILLLVIFATVTITSAHAKTTNWCGTYFEEDNQGYLRIAIDDIQKGGSSCTPESYYARIQNSGAAKIYLDFAKHYSMVANWRKFNNHILEIRGKLDYGKIISPRLIRDIGI